MREESGTAGVISGILGEAARERPRTAAVIDVRATGDSCVTWAELDALTRAGADRLRRALGPEAAVRRVVVAVDALNRLGSLLSLLSVLRAGLTCAPLDPRVPERERSRLLSALGRDHGDVYRLAAYDDEPVRHGRGAGAAAGRPGPRADYVLCGGGSTGVPRWVGARLDDGMPGLLGGYRMVLRRTGWDEGRRQLVVGPLHHAAPFTHLLAGLADRQTILVQGVFEAGRTWATVVDRRVEWLQLTPTHMRRMSAHGMPGAEDLESLRGMLHMAAPCDGATKRQWIGLLGGARVHEVYGATEQIGITIADGDEWLARPGTVGRGFLTRIRVMGEHGALPPGEPGTVYMRRGTGRGAARRDLSTVEHTPDGFLSVGDRGWLDEEGYLYLDGRRSDALQVGGASVYVTEIERVVQEVPGVGDVAVIAQAHPTLGSVPRALVTLVGGADTDARAIRRHCRRSLAAHKVPHSIEIVSELPRSEAGKLQRWRITPAAPGGASPEGPHP